MILLEINIVGDGLFLFNYLEEQTSGLKSVPVHDPIVEEAAEHAIKTIQQRSNSLLPYELQEIVHANAEVCPFFLLASLQPVIGLYVGNLYSSSRNLSVIN